MVRRFRSRGGSSVGEQWVNYWISVCGSSSLQEWRRYLKPYSFSASTAGG